MWFSPTQSGPATATITISGGAGVVAIATLNGTGDTCILVHQNGLGQTYIDCAALGSPGFGGTYNLTMAVEAASSYPITAGTITGGTVATAIFCPGALGASAVVIASGPSDAAAWAWFGPLAGHVSHNFAIVGGLAQPTCPLLTDPTWN